MIKLVWYIVNFLTIFLILFNSPNNSSLNSFVDQNSMFTFRSNQFLIQKFIIISILVFVILTILCSIYIKA
uniref:Preprotein-translocase subunit g n=1 Tax=Delesseria sanguinea TaxID=131097 RepID=A0A4D6WRK1_9FLOR|nr:Preprotein-translocase subunit g [Delesseria sanguinea]